MEWALGMLNEVTDARCLSVAPMPTSEVGGSNGNWFEESQDGANHGRAGLACCQTPTLNYL